MLTGLDVLMNGSGAMVRQRLRTSRVGVLTHAAARDRRGRDLLRVLEELGTDPEVVFAPEHGFHGAAQAEEPVPNDGATQTATAGRQPRTLSLYGTSPDSLTPKREDLEGLDVLLIDLADVGARYYTYVWTALLTARAAADAGVHSLILERPNPISADPASVEGAPQDGALLSFVGLEPIPIRHALTLAELVALFLERDGRPLGSDGALSVLGAQGWERYRTAAAWGYPFFPPSPNIPTLETALVYPGACLLEGTNLSEGRGTTRPFQLFGAPFLDGNKLSDSLSAAGTPGALIHPARFRPTFGKHADAVCHGVMLHVTDPHLFRPVATYLRVVAFARAQAPQDFAFETRPYEFESERRAFDLLIGSTAVRHAIESGAAPDDIIDQVCPVDAEWRSVVAEAPERVVRASA